MCVTMRVTVVRRGDTRCLTLSRVTMSLENLLNIRPRGVASYQLTGAPKTEAAMASCTLPTWEKSEKPNVGTNDGCGK